MPSTDRSSPTPLESLGTKRIPTTVLTFETNEDYDPSSYFHFRGGLTVDSNFLDQVASLATPSHSHKSITITIGDFGRDQSLKDIVDTIFRSPAFEKTSYFDASTASAAIAAMIDQDAVSTDRGMLLFTTSSVVHLRCSTRKTKWTINSWRHGAPRVLLPAPGPFFVRPFSGLRT